MFEIILWLTMIWFEGMKIKHMPKVSIRANGNIGFSSGAVDKFDLRNSTYCRLYMDRDAYKIGFEFTNTEEENVTAKVFSRQMDCLDQSIYGKT